MFSREGNCGKEERLGEDHKEDCNDLVRLWFWRQLDSSSLSSLSSLSSSSSGLAKRVFRWRVHMQHSCTTAHDDKDAEQVQMTANRMQVGSRWASGRVGRSMAREGSVTLLRRENRLCAHASVSMMTVCHHSSSNHDGLVLNQMESSLKRQFHKQADVASQKNAKTIPETTRTPKREVSI